MLVFLLIIIDMISCKYISDMNKQRLTYPLMIILLINGLSQRNLENEGIITPPTYVYTGNIISVSDYILHLSFMKLTHILCSHKVFELF